MAQTSFGTLEILLRQQHDGKSRPLIEHLVFEKPGRSHKHQNYETFVVLNGSGRVYAGDEVFEVQPGSLVTIDPGTSHWMEPEAGERLEGFLWYHEAELTLGKKAQLSERVHV